MIKRPWWDQSWLRSTHHHHDFLNDTPSPFPLNKVLPKTIRYPSLRLISGHDNSTRLDSIWILRYCRGAILFSVQLWAEWAIHECMFLLLFFWSWLGYLTWTFLTLRCTFHDDLATDLVCLYKLYDTWITYYYR
jgi:hypothetical protein